MSLTKNIATEIKVIIENSRQANLAIGLKNVPTPEYLPKPTRPEELDYILSDHKLMKRINGFVIEIQDFHNITLNCRRYENQETLEKGIKNPYEKFKEKVLIIDILPEQLYYKCNERGRLKRLSGIPQSLNKLLESDCEFYESNWREIINSKKGLDIQTWALKTQSAMGADVIMGLTPFLNTPSTSLLRTNTWMNVKLQDAYALSQKEYEADPSISYSMNYSVFTNGSFIDKLIESIYELADLQERKAEERDIRKASLIFFKIYKLDTQLTQCRDNFKKFLNSIPIIRDSYDLNFIFLDCANLQGQLFLSSGADLFSERTTGRTTLTAGKGSSMPGKIYLAEDGYYTNITLDEYKRKFEANGNKPLCHHEYCQKNLKEDISDVDKTNFNKESRRIHQIWSRFDDIEEILKGQKAKTLRDVKFKIGHSSDTGLNYLNPYN